MAKIENPISEDLLEGNTLTKKSLTDTYDGIDLVVVDGENIREEGLDRRNFDPDCWYASAGKVCKLESEEFLLRSNRTERWQHVELPNLVGNFDGDRPSIQFTWDPELDSSVIIRCSFFARMKDHFTSFQDAIDFGLLIIPPDKNIVTVDKILKAPLNGGIWPYQRFFKNNVFSEYAGAFSKGSEGEWNEYQYDFRGGSCQSFMLQSLGTSTYRSSHSFRPDETGGLSNQAHWFNTSGRVTAYLVFRNKVYETSTEAGPPIYIDGIHFAAIKYRR